MTNLEACALSLSTVLLWIVLRSAEVSGPPVLSQGRKHWQDQMGLYVNLLSCVFAITPAAIQGLGEPANPRRPRDQILLGFCCQLSFSRVADGPDSFWAHLRLAWGR